MLQPLRTFQPKLKLSSPYEYLMSVRGCSTKWDQHEAARQRRIATARALSFNKCPVDFEFLVYKLLKFLKADEKLATGFAAESIYCHARNLIFLGGDYQLCKETFDLFDREFSDWDESLLRKSEDGFVEPPAKKIKLASLKEKHYRMVNFVERCLRRYILEDCSISILDGDRANLPPPPIRLGITVKKSIIRYLFYDTGLPSTVFEQFFEEVPAKNS